MVDSRLGRSTSSPGYWVLVIVAIHLGLRWPLIMNAARNLSGITKPSVARTVVLRVLAAAIAIHGVWSSFALGVGTKLAMQMTLDWWNFEEAVAGFFVHCIAIAGLYIFLTYYAMNVIQQRRRRAAAGCRRWSVDAETRRCSKPISLALSLLLASACAAAGSDEVMQSGTASAEIVKVQADRQQGHLSTDGRVRDLLNHPSFAGFGRLILPWDNRAYDESMPLSNLGSLCRITVMSGPRSWWAG